MACGIQATPSSAQRRGVDPFGNHERRTSAARPSHTPRVRCAQTILQELDFGGVTWDGAPDAQHSVELPPTTGLWGHGTPIRLTPRATGPERASLTVDGGAGQRVTLSVTPPAWLAPRQGAARSLAFAGEWAVSLHHTRGYEAVVGTSHEMTLPRSGRVYVRLGGRVDVYAGGHSSERGVPRELGRERRPRRWVASRPRPATCRHRSPPPSPCTPRRARRPRAG